jgi:hypothetical protein
MVNTSQTRVAIADVNGTSLLNQEVCAQPSHLCAQRPRIRHQHEPSSKNAEIIERRRCQVLRDLNKDTTLNARNVLGQYATPSALASDMVEIAMSLIGTSRNDPIRILEPGFGSSVFTSHLLRLIRNANRRLDVTAYEIDAEFAAAFGRLWTKVAEASADNQFTFAIHQSDLTCASPPTSLDGVPRKFDLCIANPPYSRHQHLATYDKKRI